MSLLDVVYCYVTETIPFNGDFSKLRKSFKESGYKEKQVSDTTWKYTRGARVALEFNYNSEAIQMQVFLERTDQENLSIKVGNWGFPFEPLFMKKRFKKNLQRIVNDISNFQELKAQLSRLYMSTRLINPTNHTLLGPFRGFQRNTFLEYLLAVCY